MAKIFYHDKLNFISSKKKSLNSSVKTCYGQMRHRSTCTRMMGREEYGEGKELLMIQWEETQRLVMSLGSRLQAVIF